MNGKSHVTHRRLRGVLKIIWAFLFTPSKKQHNNLVSTHKIIKGNLFVPGRYIREIGGAKSK